MTRVVLTSKAADDFLEIIAHLMVAASPGAAELCNARLQRILKRLAAYPESGSPRPKLGRAIRVALMTPYLVFYTYDRETDVVGIVRIRHQRQRTDRRDLRH